MPFDAIGDTELPFDASGNYAIPAIYLAETGTTVEAAQHNTPFEDVAAALSSSFLRSGVAAMSGQFKAFSGSVTAPGIAFNASSGTGFFKTASGFAVAISGVQVAEFAAGGIISGAVPIGAGMDWWLPTAPAGWVFPYGQACTSSYPLLRQKWIDAGYPFGQSGSDPLFPDKRGRVSAAVDNLGGTAASRLTAATMASAVTGSLFGAIGGAETVTLSIAQIPSHSHAVSDPGHAHAFLRFGSADGNGGADYPNYLRNSTDYVTNVNTTGITIAANGGGGSHTNTQPTICCNYIIFAGA